MHESYICPRRELIDNEDLTVLIQAHRLCGDSPGVGITATETTHIVDGLYVIQSAHAWVADQERKQREREREASR